MTRRRDRIRGQREDYAYVAQFKRRARFLFDSNVDDDAARFLRNRGFDVLKMAALA